MSKREELKKIGDELYEVLAQKNVTFEQAKVTLDYLSIKIDYEMKRTMAVSYTHLTLPTSSERCRSRWSPYH